MASSSSVKEELVEVRAFLQKNIGELSELINAKQLPCVKVGYFLEVIVERCGHLTNAASMPKDIGKKLSLAWTCFRHNRRRFDHKLVPSTVMYKQGCYWYVKDYLFTLDMMFYGSVNGSSAKVLGQMHNKALHVKDCNEDVSKTGGDEDSEDEDEDEYVNWNACSKCTRIYSSVERQPCLLVCGDTVCAECYTPGENYTCLVCKREALMPEHPIFNKALLASIQREGEPEKKKTRSVSSSSSSSSSTTLSSEELVAFHDFKAMLVRQQRHAEDRVIAYPEECGAALARINEYAQLEHDRVEALRDLACSHVRTWHARNSANCEHFLLVTRAIVESLQPVSAEEGNSKKIIRTAKRTYDAITPLSASVGCLYMLHLLPSEVVEGGSNFAVGYTQLEEGLRGIFSVGEEETQLARLGNLAKPIVLQDYVVSPDKRCAWNISFTLGDKGRRATIVIKVPLTTSLPEVWERKCKFFYYVQGSASPFGSVSFSESHLTYAQAPESSFSVLLERGKPIKVEFEFSCVEFVGGHF